MMSPVNKWPGRNLAFVLLCLVASGGCGSRIPPDAEGATTEMAGGTVAFRRWKEGQAVMICDDIKGGTVTPTDSMQSGGTRKVGASHSSHDGRKVEWLLETSDGRSVKCHLDDKEYDLSKGALFLVKTKGGKTEVEQLIRDLSAVQPDQQSVKEFARKDAAVSKFLGIKAD
jgi:hypothetical protein